MKVAVVDTNKQPLAPCHPGRARQLLRSGQASVFRRYPFVIMLKKAVPTEDISVPKLTLQIDPGDTTGLALVENDERLVWCAAVGNRSSDIKAKNKTRASLRRGRRTRKTRYRAPRFSNRNRQTFGYCPKTGEGRYTSVKVSTPKSKTYYSRVPQHLLRDRRFEWVKLETPRVKERREVQKLKNGKTREVIRRTTHRWRRKHAGTGHEQSRRGKHGWIAPSLLHQLQTEETWVRRLIRYYPITEIAIEKSSFDIAKMLEPDIKGEQYQRGTLYGEDQRSYVLRKFKHTCQYCGAKGTGRNSVILELDHVLPRSRGGTDVVSNLVPACRACNQRKGNRFSHEIDDEVLREKVEKAMKAVQKPMKSPTTMNILQKKRIDMVTAIFGKENVSFGYGSWTKHHRKAAGLPKTHYYDAACLAGPVTPMPGLQVLHIRPKGHGNRDLFRSKRVKKNGKMVSLPGFLRLTVMNKHLGKEVSAKMVSHRGGFAKYDRVQVKQNVKGVLRTVTGVITSFENTKPQYCRVEVPLEQAIAWGMVWYETTEDAAGKQMRERKGDKRFTCLLTDLTRIQRRDGYAYFQEPVAPPLCSPA